MGINLLREGIDIPEVSLIAILDADKQGFLRSEKALIQTIGRAARNADGHVIMFADKMSPAMEVAINETERRRDIQRKHNLENNIIPTTIEKEIREVVSNRLYSEIENKSQMTKAEKERIIKNVEEEMNRAAKNLEFERAMELRDILFEIKSS